MRESKEEEETELNHVILLTKELAIMGLKEENYKMNYCEAWMGLNYERSLYVEHMGITTLEHAGID